MYQESSREECPYKDLPFQKDRFTRTLETLKLALQSSGTGNSTDQLHLAGGNRRLPAGRGKEECFGVLLIEAANSLLKLSGDNHGYFGFRNLVDHNLVARTFNGIEDPETTKLVRKLGEVAKTLIFDPSSIDPHAKRERIEECLNGLDIAHRRFFNVETFSKQEVSHPLAA